MANPDGYDFTFTEGNRLWRKNLHDNDGDGVISGLDGVDLNRNFPTSWGYDNEGSSPAVSSETYRGAAPRSEPETRALDDLMKRVRFAFQINYHSAAELILYGVGSQVATPSPDDLLYETLVGDDAHPAIPGTTRTSRPSSTRPTERPPSTPKPSTAPLPSPRRCRPAKPPVRWIPTMLSTQPTARAGSTSPTPRR